MSVLDAVAGLAVPRLPVTGLAAGLTVMVNAAGLPSATCCCCGVTVVVEATGAGGGGVTCGTTTTVASPWLGI